MKVKNSLPAEEFKFPMMFGQHLTASTMIDNLWAEIRALQQVFTLFYWVINCPRKTTILPHN